ncbi:MAG: ABC transporter ATP-binding protein [Planctomycetes bacterium]|nr:ABC transporter ATP-binding protein [Planctomycetota bacterium]
MPDTAPAPAPSGAPTRAREPIVEVIGLEKSFKTQRVLRNVNLTVYRGETMVIMGGSGCGKSTLLGHLVGFHRPDSGSIRIFGRDILRLATWEMDEVKKRFGILFQSGALYNSMTIAENVALPMREHAALDRDIIDMMVKMKLKMVGWTKPDSLKPSEISGGMKKRAGLARAIALDPELLFYDEPTAGLDPIASAEIAQLIVDLRDKLRVTSVVVTHDMTSAFHIADRMCYLHLGDVRMIGTPEEFRKTDDPLVRQFIDGSLSGPLTAATTGEDYLRDLLGEE